VISRGDPKESGPVSDVPKSEVDAIEGQIDAEFEATPVPGDDLYRSYWVLCATAERKHLEMLLRFAPAFFSEDDSSQRHAVGGVLDRYKFVLRHALDLCRCRLQVQETKHERAPLTPGDVEAAEQLLTGASGFALATKSFSGYRGGTYRVVREQPSEPIKFVQAESDIPYLALDLFRDDPDDKMNALSFMMGLLASGHNRKGKDPFVPMLGTDLQRVISSVKIQGARLKYSVVTSWADIIAGGLRLGPYLIPDEWSFPWGTPDELRKFFLGLFSRCLYHLLAVSVRTAREGYEGYRLNHICLALTRSELASDIARIGKLDLSRTRSIVDALTLGEAMKTPDPALQPLIPIGNERLALPCLHIVSGNYERNLLSLHARVSANDFDKQSKLFEKAMTDRITAKVPSSINFRADIWVRTDKDSEQVDLMLIDHTAHHLLLCEFRWMNRPGDSREISNRKSGALGKVTQAARKLAGARNVLPDVLGDLGIAGTLPWQIDAVVVLEGFGGLTSPNAEIPIIPKEAFVEILNRAGRTDIAHSIMSSTEWLPRANVDYEYWFSETAVLGTKIIAHHMRQAGESYLERSLPRYVSEALEKSEGRA
jgi:hypothetical protein